MWTISIQLVVFHTSSRVQRAVSLIVSGPLSLAVRKHSHYGDRQLCGLAVGMQAAVASYIGT